MDKKKKSRCGKAESLRIYRFLTESFIPALHF